MAWHPLWPDQRAALVHALRCMPHLASFSSRNLDLRTSDIAPLASLTRVSLGGLLPTERHNPPPEPLPASARRGQPEPPRGLQQQQLHPGRGVQLRLCKAASVGFLASLHEHWPGLGPIIWSSKDLPDGEATEKDSLVDLFFGVVQGTNTLLPHTPDTVRRAVGAVVYGSGGPAGQQQSGAVFCPAGAAGTGGRKIEVLGVRADAGPPHMLEPMGQGQGHAAWTRELAPLACPGQVVD